VHTAATHGDFVVRFSQIRYQVVIVEELFAANHIGENFTLKALQDDANEPAPSRYGDSSRNFVPNVHSNAGLSTECACVINTSELFLLPQLIEKAVADNNLFLHHFQRGPHASVCRS
jgi:hypothetical protein